MTAIRLQKTDLLPGLPGVAAFSTQRGPDATATDPYSGFNTCDYVGDSPGHVAACRRALADAVGARRFVFPRQTHSLNVAVIDSDAMPPLEDVDALVTDRPGTALCIHTADCVPVVIADAEAGVIAAIHSGWRGTVGRIVERAVGEMVRLGAHPRHMTAAMGPCICEECFEVGEEVAEAFRHAGLGDAVAPRLPRPHISLPRAVAMSLRDCGVRHIIAPPACSRCAPLRYCSARACGIASSRTLTLIAMPLRQ